MDKNDVFSVDRMVDNLAVLVDGEGNSYPVARANLPEQVKAGDVLRMKDGAFYLNEEEKERRQAYVSDLQNRLRRRK